MFRAFLAVAVLSLVLAGCASTKGTTMTRTVAYLDADGKVQTREETYVIPPPPRPEYKPAQTLTQCQFVKC